VAVEAVPSFKDAVRGKEAEHAIERSGVGTRSRGQSRRGLWTLAQRIRNPEVGHRVQAPRQDGAPGELPPETAQPSVAADFVTFQVQAKPAELSVPEERTTQLRRPAPGGRGL